VRVLDSRRVTGPNLAAREPGVVVELALDGADGDAVIAAWREAITRVLPWPGEPHARKFVNGLALFVPGPLDVLMPLTDLNEYAVACAEAQLAGQPAPVLDPALRAAIDAARVPGMAEMIAAARAHDRDLLVDDLTITLGAGRDGIVTFPRTGPLPDPASIDWDHIGRVPIALITGTNGKTTTARLVARIAHAAGRVPGCTSSDGVAISEKMVEKGDFSGPEGARYVLRHPEVNLAVLETARGGILRRGLAVDRCDAALITNVSADHLGDYGIDDVQAMARVKAVVAGGAKRVVLNAGDPQLVELAPAIARAEDLTWFGGDGERGVRAVFVKGGQIVIRDERGERALLAVADAPITFGGRAAYNIANALAAAALAHALDLPDEAIAAGLRSFTSSAQDNPGRGNVLDLAGGMRVVLDFGHNSAAIHGVISLARALVEDRGVYGQLRVSIGMPGDRSDAELGEVARAIATGAPVEVIVRELPAYLLRGREVGAAADVIAAELATAGIAVRRAPDELTAVEMGLAASKPGDLLLILVHLDPAVDARLA
jgi:UDP-N-acetylmuramyl tripeptide synthase